MIRKYALPIVVVLCVSLALGLIVALVQNSDLNARSATLNDQFTSLANDFDVLAAEATSSVAMLQKPDAPSLLQPADGATFSNVAEAKLVWQWGRPLESTEYFDVRVWTEGQPANGITWTKDSSFDMTNWLFNQTPTTFFWSVAVVKQLDANSEIEQITKVGETRSFTLSRVDLSIMTVPAGFKAALWAKLPFTLPTVITFGENGTLYALGSNGQIASATVSDGGTVADRITMLYDDPNDQLDGAVGLALRDGKFYVSDAGKISILTDSDGDGSLDTLTPIITGLPTRQYTFHSNNGLAFGPDGKLYFPVGATSDHGPLREKYEASILRANPDGSDLEIFATGFRNPYDLVFTPSGDLFAGDNSPDAINNSLAYLPPEELNFIQQGKDYGFPNTFGNMPYPNSEPPLVELPTSSASSGITYYDAAMFPLAYHGLYLAQFGTGAAYPVASGVKTGQAVVLITLSPDGQGGYHGSWQVFARMRTDLGDYHPIDVTVGPDGALYVAEYMTGTIFRISYEGEADASATSLSTAPNEQIAQGEQLFLHGTDQVPACVTCHVLDGSAATGPSLVNLSANLPPQAAGMTTEDYIRQSILQPNAVIVPGYQGNIMYQNYAERLSSAQIEALVAYVGSLSQR
ncbi:MAG: PQQ-dependent sugar dehydrogenase [Anaerolineae bacterium]|nr:PQQ-dependent sugar dehydrogenase [Anaerolineae bacterium]